MELNREFFVTVIFTFINIVVLYLILKKLLFKPIMSHMDERSKKIQESLDMAEEAKKQVAEMKTEYDAKLKLAKEEGTKIIDDYKKRADKEYQKALDEAKKESELIIQKAKTELEVEREQIVNEVKKEMTTLVLDVSQKILKENINTETNKKLIDEFVNDSVISKN